MKLKNMKIIFRLILVSIFSFLSFLWNKILTKGPEELVELIQALSLNKSLSIENRHVIAHNFIKREIFKGWSKYFEKNTTLLYQIVINCFELNYHYSPLLTRAAAQLIKHKKFTNLNKIVTLYNILKKIDQEGVSEYEMKYLIEAIKEKLQSKKDYLWRYNNKENRYYTYKEMKAKRDNVDLSNTTIFYDQVIESDEKNDRVWHHHWVHLVMKRDMTKYMKKMRDLDASKTPYEIDFENFNPKRANENIKLLGKDHLYESNHSDKFNDDSSDDS